MSFRVGFWDMLFGKRIEMEVPLPDGTIKKVLVTEKWFQEQKRAGRITPVDGIVVRLHILDSTIDDIEKFMMEMEVPQDKYRLELLKVGKDISVEQFEKAKQADGDLYGFARYENNAKVVTFVTKQQWEAIKLTGEQTPREFNEQAGAWVDEQMKRLLEDKEKKPSRG
jgi:hypothetical protein